MSGGHLAVREAALSVAGTDAAGLRGAGCVGGGAGVVTDQILRYARVFHDGTDAEDVAAVAGYVVLGEGVDALEDSVCGEKAGGVGVDGTVPVEAGRGFVQPEQCFGVDYGSAVPDG